MQTSDTQISLLAVGNLGLEVVSKWLPPLVQVGQVAVALVTVIYILRKIHLLKKKKKTDEDELT